MWHIGPQNRLVRSIVCVVWAGAMLACSHMQFLARRPPPGRDFLIIGHRGAPNLACENTLKSFAEAVRFGANALELDLSMTQDAQLVLWHDWGPSLEGELRPSGVCRLLHPLLPSPIHTISLAEFQRDYGYEQEGQRVPAALFEAFVQRFAHDSRVRWFFLDLKIPEDRPDLVSPLFHNALQTLRRYKAIAKAVFSTPYQSIFYPLFDEAQRWQQETGTRVEIAQDVEGPQLLQLSNWTSAVRRNQGAEARFALWGKPVITLQSARDFLLNELQRRDAANATRPPQARMHFIVWTVNDASDLCDLVGLGVDGIITDEPDRLQAVVQSLRQHGTCRLS